MMGDVVRDWAEVLDLLCNPPVGHWAAPNKAPTQEYSDYSSGYWTCLNDVAGLLKRHRPSVLTPQAEGWKAKIAETLYQCERRRSDITDAVIARTTGGAIRRSMKASWAEAEDHDRKAFLDDADAIMAMLGLGEGDGSARASRDAGLEPAPVGRTPLEWRPMETHPREGPILCWGPDGYDIWARPWGVRQPDDPEMSHWMPLPEPPAESGADVSPMKRHSPETPADQKPFNPQPLTGGER